MVKREREREAHLESCREPVATVTGKVASPVGRCCYSNQPQWPSDAAWKREQEVKKWGKEWQKIYAEVFDLSKRAMGEGWASYEIGWKAWYKKIKCVSAHAGMHAGAQLGLVEISTLSKQRWRCWMDEGRENPSLGSPLGKNRSGTLREVLHKLNKLTSQLTTSMGWWITGGYVFISQQRVSQLKG